MEWIEYFLFIWAYLLFLSNVWPGIILHWMPPPAQCWPGVGEPTSRGAQEEEGGSVVIINGSGFMQNLAMVHTSSPVLLRWAFRMSQILASRELCCGPPTACQCGGSDIPHAPASHSAREQCGNRWWSIRRSWRSSFFLSFFSFFLKCFDKTTTVQVPLQHFA